MFARPATMLAPPILPNRGPRGISFPRGVAPTLLSRVAWMTS